MFNSSDAPASRAHRSDARSAEAPASGAPCATVVITTRNRKDDLRAAIASARAQSVRPEVLVIDDGSTDGTSDMVRAEFPGVRLDRADESSGLIVQRNRGAALARGEIVFSIDDDAAFSTPDVVAQTLREFDHPRVGAVAIPFVNVNQSPAVFQRAPQAEGVWVASTYIGTAHAVRRELFLRLGGYRGALVHQGEEGDYCIRMLQAGYVVRLGRADVIHHFESPRRDLRRMSYYGRRNDVLFAAHNVPLPHVAVHLLGTTFVGLRFTLRQGFNRNALAGLRGIGAGYAAAAAGWFHHRRPVSAKVYRLARELKHHGSVPLSEIAHRVPAPTPSSEGAPDNAPFGRKSPS